MDALFPDDDLPLGLEGLSPEEVIGSFLKRYGLEALRGRLFAVFRGYVSGGSVDQKEGFRMEALAVAGLFDELLLLVEALEQLQERTLDR